MRVYLEVARRSFGRFATYRGATLAGVFTNTVFGFILASVLRSALGDRTIGGLDQVTATLYTFTAQGLLMVISAFGDHALSRSVQSGEVATELHRPWDWSAYRLAFDLGRSAYYLLARGIPPFVAGWLFYRFPLPSAGRFVMLVIAAFGAAALASRFWTLVGMVSFWLIDGSGVVQLASVVTMMATGALIPLSLFPPWLGDWLRLLPFASMLQRPIEMFLGQRGLIDVLVVQLVWLVVLELLVRTELFAARRKLEIQGG